MSVLGSVMRLEIVKSRLPRWIFWGLGWPEGQMVSLLSDGGKMGPHLEDHPI